MKNIAVYLGLAVLAAACASEQPKTSAPVTERGSQTAPSTAGTTGAMAANDAATPNPQPSSSSTGLIVALPLLLGGGLVGRRARRSRHRRLPDVRLWSS